MIPFRGSSPTPFRFVSIIIRMVFHYTMLYKVLPNLDTLLLQTLESGCRGHFSNARLDTSPSYRDSTRTTVAPKRKRRNDKLVLETERRRERRRVERAECHAAPCINRSDWEIDRIGAPPQNTTKKSPPKNLLPTAKFRLDTEFGACVFQG